MLSKIRSKEEAGEARRDEGCFSKEENANVDINEPRSSYYMRIIPGKELVQNGAVFCINVQPHSSQWRVCFRQVHQMRWLWTCCDCTPDAVGLWCVSGFFRLQSFQRQHCPVELSLMMEKSKISTVYEGSNM